MTTTDWIATGSVLTGVSALATALMAFFTRKAAKDTSTMAKATADEARAIEQQLGHSADQVRVAEQSLRASAQPWLAWEETFEVPVPSRASGSEPGTGAYIYNQSTFALRGGLRVHNVGNGLAIVDLSESWVLACVPQAPGQRERRGHPAIDNPVIPAGGSAEITFAVDLEGENGTGPTFDELVGRSSTAGQFALEICYRDAIRRSPTRAIFSLESPRHEYEWVVSRIEYRTDATAQAPFAVTFRELSAD